MALNHYWENLINSYHHYHTHSNLLTIKQKMSQTVFISGASGYIAQHITAKLLAKGYKVIGSVRSAKKGDELKSLFKNENLSYVVVPDIQADGAFDEALKQHPEISVFLHTASPFVFQVEDVEKELLLPAVTGTKVALTSVLNHGPQIKRVVVTSSYAAMFANEDIPDVVSDETTWTELTWEQAKQNGLVGYLASKAFAEKAAWDFVEKEKPNFKLSTVNPTYVFGPQLFDEYATGPVSTSVELIKAVLKLQPTDEVPSVQGPFIDVRDVADAHLVAFESDAAIGQRILLQDGRFSNSKVVEIIKANFPEFKDKIPAPKTTHEEEIKSHCKLDSSKSDKILGIKFISIEQSIKDTVAQFIKVKAV